MNTGQHKVLNEFHLDKHQVRSGFDRAASRYDEVAVLQREIGQRMIERLDLIRLQPHMILDAGSGTGNFSISLSQRYPKARIISMDLSLTMLNYAQRRTTLHSVWRRLPVIGTRLSKQMPVCGDIEQLPLSTGSVDMIFSNLTLQWCNDLDHVFEEFRRILKPGGLLMFSTFGPDTLKELRDCWRQIDQFTHVNTFIDMHDIGDALLRHRFSEPVMDAEHFTLTYRDAGAVMKDLKMLGAHNVTSGRRQTLTGKGRIQALIKAYESYRRDGVLPASYEAVYGHAWAGDNQPPTPDSSHEARIPLSQLHKPMQRK